MNKILFSHSYFLRYDPKQWAQSQPYAPLGTLYAASLMREKGFEVSVFDTMFCRQPAEVTEALDTSRPDFFVIYDDGFNYLTKMCLTNMRHAAFEMIKLAKQRGCTVIVSSSDATDHFEKYIEEGADFILTGEAEYTLLELIQCLQQGKKDLTTVAGMAFKQNDYIIKTVKRALIKDLDALPLPAWDLIDITPYRKSWMTSKGFFSMNVATTRGCPYKCNWCAKPIYGNRYNSRSPENVVRELLLLRKNFQFDHIWFCDDIFGLKPGWIEQFAALIEKEGLPFRYKIQSRADLLTHPEYVEGLARTGCQDVWIGAESGSQKILDAMDKGITVEQISMATKNVKAHGIRPSFFIQFGYPGETREDIRLTITMINRLLPSEIGISVSYPLPGTGFYEKVKTELKEKANWTDSDEMMLMFKNTYQPEFYKRLHHYVHTNYRKHIAWTNIVQLFVHPFKTNLSVLKKACSAVYYLPASYIERIKLKKLENA